ncbi:AraC family transcriptional regulator [Dyella flava]|nr:AraC family transcriptional regulator [Dyella flava]
MLQLLGAKSVVTGALIAGGSWSISFPPPDRIKFWGIVKGRCWVRMGDEPAIELRAGDVLLILQPSPMTLTTDPDTPSVGIDEVLSKANGEVCKIGDGEDFMLIGGTVMLDPRGRSLLFGALPPTIHVGSGVVQAEALRWILDQLMRERVDRLPGADAASTQLVHLMFIHILRAHLAQDDLMAPGWLRLASDRRFTAVLALMHEQPGKDWSLLELAKAAGMSRATFALHFKAAAGMGPLGYLTEWRMHLAERALRQDGVSIARLAESLGYASESAFSHAFKRVTGRAPKWVRRNDSAAESASS